MLLIRPVEGIFDLDAHRYTYHLGGSDHRPVFAIYDDWWGYGDNEGSLTVQILAPRAGVRAVAMMVHGFMGIKPGTQYECPDDGRPLDAAALDAGERIDAILCWSAVPGGSRHHWGTDCDLIDAAALPEGYRVQLVPEEYARGGVFERLTAWLDENMGRFGFYRPYASTGCGAGVEPWHVSYWPVAHEALEALTLPVLRRAVAGSAVLGKEQVLERLPEIYTRFILAVDSPPAVAGRASLRPA